MENLDESDQFIMGIDFVRNFDVKIELNDGLIRIKDPERKHEKKPLNKMQNLLIRSNQAKVPIFNGLMDISDGLMDIIFVPSFVMSKILTDMTFSFILCFLGSCLSSFVVLLKMSTFSRRSVLSSSELTPCSTSFVNIRKHGGPSSHNSHRTSSYPCRREVCTNWSFCQCLSRCSCHNCCKGFAPSVL